MKVTHTSDFPDQQGKTLTLSTQWDKHTGDIVSELTEQMDGEARRISAWVVKSHEAQVIHALTELGWAEPKAGVKKQ